MRNQVRWGKEVYGMLRYVRRVANGHYQLEWRGDVVEMRRYSERKDPYWLVTVNGAERGGMFGSFNDTLRWVDNVWGNEQVDTYNMLNRKAGSLKIARKDRGGCTDPSTETYWSM